MWELINPSPDFYNVRDSCRAYWNALTLERQRLLYYYIREQKRRGISLKANPLYVIQDCNPVPTNLNGTNKALELLKANKLVIAKYHGQWGTYSLQEANLFGMTDIKKIGNN